MKQQKNLVKVITVTAIEVVTADIGKKYGLIDKIFEKRA